MAFLIILLSVVLTGICLGVGYGYFHISPLAPELPSIPASDTRKVKIGAILLTLIHTCSLINYVKHLLIMYSKGWEATDVKQSLLLAFSQAFTLIVIMLYILFAVFLLLKKEDLSIIISLYIIIFELIKSVFWQKTSVISACIDFVPQIAFLVSLIIISILIDINSKSYNRYKKVLKLSPYFALIKLVYIIISKFASSSLNLDIVISNILPTIIEFVAYWTIITALITYGNKYNDVSEENQSLDFKKQVCILLALIAFPILIYFLSSINKVILLATITCVSILIPFIFKWFAIENKSTRFIAAILIIVLVFGMCMILSNKNDNTGNRCNHPVCKENGPFYCMGKNNTCPNKTYCCYDLYCDSCD